MNSLYGNYRTRTFSDVFPSADTFLAQWRDCPLGAGCLTDDETNKIWFLLASKYMNSHICYSDENQFKFMLFQLLYANGPTYCKKMDIQEKLRNLTDSEIVLGTKMIYNHAFNPNSAPSTSTLTEIETINDQNTSNTLRGKLQAYGELHSLLNTDLTNQFLRKFKDLFLKIVEPQLPLWYVSEEGDEE